MSYWTAISGLGSSGGVGGSGSGGSSYQSEARSSASGGAFGSDSHAAGNRGFLNNVAFPGARLNADQGINPPITGRLNPMTLLLGIGGLIVVLALVKKFMS